MKRNRWRFRNRCLSLLICSLMAVSLLMFIIYFSDFDENAVKAEEHSQNVSTKKSINDRISGIWLEKIKSEEIAEESWRTDQVKRNIDPALMIDLLPHLKANINHGLRSLNARVLLKAKNILRSPPEMLLMVPSKHREKYNYLNDTLRNLIDNMHESERHLVQIIVILSENPWEENTEAHLAEAVSGIESNFGDEVNEGLIEVIAPPSEWFPPNIDHIQPTLGDSAERMRWRVKQALDYAFAMYHTNVQRSDARFYVQLEDDIITMPGFVSELHRFTNDHPGFFMCEFANLGFIGRVFHNGKDLAQLAHFILLFYQSLPVDWLLINMINTKFCSLDENLKGCSKKHLYGKVLFSRHPPLFQHVGKHSSLSGKVQNLKEKHYKNNARIDPLNAQNPSISGFHSELATTERWRAFYEKNMPLKLRKTDLERDELVEFDYRDQPISELKGLRIMFTAKFGASDLASVPLPNSLLTVNVTHHSSTQFASNNHTDHSADTLVQTTFPSIIGQRPPPLHSHFLWIPANSDGLKGVRSIRVFLSLGAWRNSLELFTLSAIRVIT